VYTRELIYIYTRIYVQVAGGTPLNITRVPLPLILYYIFVTVNPSKLFYRRRTVAHDYKVCRTLFAVMLFSAPLYIIVIVIIVIIIRSLIRLRRENRSTKIPSSPLHLPLLRRTFEYGNGHMKKRVRLKVRDKRNDKTVYDVLNNPYK